MGLYEDLIALGWSENQLSYYYPELRPGDTTWTPTVSAEERSYQDSLAAFERGYQLSLYGSEDTEYRRQLYLQEHPEYFGDVGRAQTEIGIPSDVSFAASYPQYATGTRYEEYGTTAPAFQTPQDGNLGPSSAPSLPMVGSPGEWGDMMAAGVLGGLMLAGLGLLLGVK